MNEKDNYNFVLYGDSISKGVVYDDKKEKYIVSEESYSNLLQNTLKGVVHNASRFGNTIIRAAGKLQNDVLKKNPDIVVIEFGGNDCDFKWEEIAQNPHGRHEPNTDFNIFGKSLKALIELLESTGIVPVLMTIPPLDADRYFKWISKNSTFIGEKILTWLGSISKIYWWQERYNSAIISIAQETKTRWIDIRSAFLKTPDFRQFLCLDGIHPNNQGHRLIADKIMEYIKLDYRFLLRDDAVYVT
jgi:acyl-CoA thioesterase I